MDCLAQFSLDVHKGGLKPDSFHFILFGANCSKATKFGPDDDRILLDRFWVNAKRGIALRHRRGKIKMAATRYQEYQI